MPGLTEFNIKHSETCPDYMPLHMGGFGNYWRDWDYLNSCNPYDLPDDPPIGPVSAK